MAAGVNLQVCASDPCDGADIHVDPCFSFHQLWVPVTEGEESSKRKHPKRVCVHVMMVSPLVYCVPVAMKAREETPNFGGAKSDIDIFGPLKFALGNTSAFCANSTVRLQSPAHNHHFTRFSGNHRRGEQALEPPLTHSCTRKLFRFMSERLGRAERSRRFDTVRHYSSFTPCAHSPLESSRPSGNNCRCFPRSRD